MYERLPQVKQGERDAGLKLVNVPKLMQEQFWVEPSTRSKEYRSPQRNRGDR
jgi:hypothetical protein